MDQSPVGYYEGTGAMFSVGPRKHLYRLGGAMVAVCSALAASAVGMPEGGASAQRGAASKAEASAPAGRATKAPGGESPKAAPATGGEKKAKPVIVAGIRCRHGVLEDPHRGFVRCLALDEKDAKWLPPAPQPEPVAAAPKAPAPVASAPAAPPTSVAPSPPFVAPPSSTAAPAPSAVASAAPPSPSAPPASSAAPAATPPRPSAPPEVEVKPPTFESGDVPGAEKALTKLADSIAKCVADNGGLTKPTGTLKIQFLVRARGRAEGVEVLSSQGISPEGAACVRQFLKNRNVGHPTSDPVGVTVVLNFKPPAR